MKKLIILLFPFIAFAQIDNTKLQHEFVKELNSYRVSKGLNVVKLTDSDNKKAECQTRYCVSIETLTHDYPEFKSVYAECGAFLSNLPDARYCLNGWINSPSHNYLLLLPDIDTIGIFCSAGVNDNENGYFIFLVLN